MTTDDSDQLIDPDACDQLVQTTDKLIDGNTEELSAEDVAEQYQTMLSTTEEELGEQSR